MNVLFQKTSQIPKGEKQTGEKGKISDIVKLYNISFSNIAFLLVRKFIEHGKNGITIPYLFLVY
jgi:hypothetical protein